MSETRTNQQIFDKVAAHLLKQGKQSMMEGGYHTCAYKGRDGLKCAVGCLIPDDKYSEQLENLSACSIEVREALEFVPQEGQAFFLATLQGIHDNQEPYSWKASLTELATKHGLDASVLKEFE